MKRINSGKLRRLANAWASSEARRRKSRFTAPGALARLRGSGCLVGGDSAMIDLREELGSATLRRVTGIDVAAGLVGNRADRPGDQLVAICGYAARVPDANYDAVIDVRP